MLYNTFQWAAHAVALLTSLSRVWQMWRMSAVLTPPPHGILAVFRAANLSTGAERSLRFLGCAVAKGGSSTRGTRVGEARVVLTGR